MNAATAFQDSEPTYLMHANPSSGWQTLRTGGGQALCFRSQKEATAHARVVLARRQKSEDDLAETSIFSRSATKEITLGLTELIQQQRTETRKRLAARLATVKRLAELKDEAAEEGVAISKASEVALKAFLSAAPFTRRPYITLLDNGNLRAFWEDRTAGEEVGLQFLGGDVVQYVIFARREVEGQPYIARLAGRDVVTSIDGQIESNGLRRLMA